MRFRWLLALAFCCTAAGCSTKGSENIRIGLAAPLSGNAAQYGEMMRHGVLLKIEEVNRAGGIGGQQVELVAGDDAGDPREAATVATKLSSDASISIVIGHFNSSCSLAGKPIYARAGVVELSPGSTNVQVCEGSPWTFRNIYRDDFQGQFLARYAAEGLNMKRVAIFHDNDDYGIGLKDAFMQEAGVVGISVVEVEAYTRESFDFTPQLTKFKALDPDAIFISGLYNEAALIATQARKLGLTTQLLGADGVFSPGFIDIAGRAAEGTILTCPFLFDEAGSEAQAFFNAFEERFSVVPDCWAALAYDAAGIAIEAIETVGPDRTKIRDYLAAMRGPDSGYDGITGMTYFDANGDCLKPVFISIVRGGRFVKAS
jgi:branched-chain amino acid transport system substrate-binding protein